MKKHIILLLNAILFFSCSVTKHELNTFQTEKIDNLIENKYFEIKCDWAQPQVTGSFRQIQNSGLFPIGSSSSNINISNSNNYFRMKEGRVVANLPYYGEQRVGGVYTNNAVAVAFDDVPKNLKISKGKNGNYYIKFNIRSKHKSSEHYKVNIKLFNNLSSTIYISSSHRSSIEYDGHAKALVEAQASL
ncbi:DUF4251 domain-containing protein [uncultured Lacinutrix sp.]|uniref:DUF4251 domain-containing protein n=1 Tax=uncultured Lacinutrix sp. TaxID=574032 RepID=UPI002610842E|nr:DUF4251 domain-containing protein [uncultured Lacinutrix sp.]